nr:PREDICTED: tumor necrosis factor receptor superfamily member 13B [Latimeria chalumnae]|eukprot:XP_014350624.1 PREDICTED: tumor necrosis factor receptor superfamily member 13B [Latimeria chalumnae]
MAEENTCLRVAERVSKVDFSSSDNAIKCNKMLGFYYDNLLSNCINCSHVCGQHPKKCSLICEKTTAATAFSLETVKITQLKSAASQCHVQPIYSLLSLGLCIVASSILIALTCHIMRKKKDSTQHPMEIMHNTNGLSKDQLVESKNVERGSTGSGTPEPVETCTFCFPDHKPFEEENKIPASHHQCVPVPPAETEHCGVVPDHENRAFTIICSPSQK